MYILKYVSLLTLLIAIKCFDYLLYLQTKIKIKIFINIQTDDIEKVICILNIIYQSIM